MLKHILLKTQGEFRKIPKEPVLGGTMRFTSVISINDELIIAEYEDSHILGKGIYRYRIDESGEFNLKILTTLDY